MKPFVTLLIAVVLTTSCKQKEDIAGTYDVVTVAGESYAAYGMTLLIEMGEENKISGHSGCNQYFGTFENPKNYQVKIGSLAGTKMYCKEKSAVERNYLEQLSNVTEVKPVQNGLELRNAKGEVLIITQKK